MSEYLDFVLVPRVNMKTTIWRVVATRDGATLGWIKWFGRWRQYAFYPGAGTIWNPECLDAVNAKIRELMAERRSLAAGVDEGNKQ